MKSLTEYTNNQLINEDVDVSKIGEKIDNIFKKNQNKLTRIIQSRQEHWDADKTPWAREPMFLVAGPKNDFDLGSNRDYSWVRWKYMKGKRNEVQGTFKNYNVASGDDNSKPNSVIGIYYDRHFELITSMAVFNTIYDLLDKDYEKYYNNLYENKSN